MNCSRAVLFAFVAMVLCSVAHGQVVFEGSLAPGKERRREEFKKLKVQLENASSPEAVQQAVAEFDAAMTQLWPKAGRSGPGNDAASQARTAEAVTRMEEGPRKAMMQEQIAFFEKVKAVKESTQLTDEQQNARLMELMESHGSRMAELRPVLAAARELREPARGGVFSQAMKEETEKLKTALQTPDAVRQQEALDQFHAAIEQFREERTKQFGNQTTKERADE